LVSNDQTSRVFFFKIKNVKSKLSNKSSNAVNFKSKRISIQKKNEQDDEIYGKEGSGLEISEKMKVFIIHIKKTFSILPT